MCLMSPRGASAVTPHSPHGTWEVTFHERLSALFDLGIGSHSWQLICRRMPLEARLPSEAAEGLLATPDGRLLEGLITNLFVVIRACFHKC